MKRYERRLDKLTDWVLERQWTYHAITPHAVANDPEWLQLMDELVALFEDVPQPPPVTFTVNPRMVRLYAAKLRIPPDAYRQDLWEQSVVSATVAGRRLWQRIQERQAQVIAEQEERWQ